LERLKERIGIRHDHTLLLLAIWWGLLELGNSPPERLTKEYIKKLMERAEAQNKKTIRSIAEKGLRDLAKYFGMIR
jgi:hypothetical protein